MNDTELSVLLDVAAHLQTALMHVEQTEDDMIFVHIQRALGLVRSVLMGDHQ